MHPTVAHEPYTLGSFLDLHPQSIRVVSRTGIPIVGRFFPGKSGSTIILSHGYGDDQDAMLPWAAFLHRAGFSVFTYDMRGVGQSGGASTLGVLETDDLVSVVDYLASRPDVDHSRIGALGFSLGGAVSVLAAAHDPRIKAVVDDSGLADIREWVNPGIWSGLPHPADPLSYLSLKLSSLRTGTDILSFRPVSEIAHISPRPILIIQGTADTTVPVSEGRQNYAAALQPKQLWMISGAGHGQALAREGTRYTDRTVTFFRAAFQGQSK